MSDAAGFTEELWREVHSLLRDLADEATARDIVLAAYRRVMPELVEASNDTNEQRCLLLDAARDLCVDHLLGAREDDSMGKRRSRAECLILLYLRPGIQAAVGRRISNCHDKEEVVNDVLTNVWRCLGRFDGGRRQLHSYVKKACDSACNDRYRRIPTRRRPDGEPATIQFEELSPEHEGVGPYQDDGREQRIVEELMLLKDVLPLLPPDQRHALWAFLKFDSWLEAERELGIPRQTLASRFQAARRRLVELLGGLP